MALLVLGVEKNFCFLPFSSINFADVQNKKNWISGCFGLGLEKKKKRGFNDLHEFKLGKINVEATDCAMIVYIFYELYS